MCIRDRRALEALGRGPRYHALAHRVRPAGRDRAPPPGLRRLRLARVDVARAARGVQDVVASQPESAKARKRRAVAACRTDAVRERMAAGTAAECLERALAGETDFVLGKS